MKVVVNSPSLGIPSKIESSVLRACGSTSPATLAAAVADAAAVFAPSLVSDETSLKNAPSSSSGAAAAAECSLLLLLLLLLLLRPPGVALVLLLPPSDEALPAAAAVAASSAEKSSSTACDAADPA